MTHVFKAHGDLQTADHVRTVWHLWTPAGVSIDDATSVKSFVHVANKLRPNDEIIIRAEDDAFYARVLVRMVMHLDVVVTVLDYFQMKESVGAPVDSEFEINYINGRYKWGFKRRGASDWIKKELPTEAAAISELADHKKALAA